MHREAIRGRSFVIHLGSESTGDAVLIIILSTTIPTMNEEPFPPALSKQAWLCVKTLETWHISVSRGTEQTGGIDLKIFRERGRDGR